MNWHFIDTDGQPPCGYEYYLAARTDGTVEQMNWEVDRWIEYDTDNGKHDGTLLVVAWAEMPEYPTRPDLYLCCGRSLPMDTQCPDCGDSVRGTAYHHCAACRELRRLREKERAA